LCRLKPKVFLKNKTKLQANLCSEKICVERKKLERLHKLEFSKAFELSKSIEKRPEKYICRSSTTMTRPAPLKPANSSDYTTR
jgi:hypothetical protein